MNRKLYHIFVLVEQEETEANVASQLSNGILYITLLYN